MFSGINKIETCKTNLHNKQHYIYVNEMNFDLKKT